MKKKIKKTKKLTEKIIAFCLACSMILGSSIGTLAADKPVYETNVTTASSTTIIVGYEGSYVAQAQAALDRINQIRKEACDEGIKNPANSSKNLTPSDYVPLKWSSDLEYIARIRAAEASLMPNHSRPSGKGTFAISSNGISSNAEVLAWNGYSNNVIGGINQWYGEKEDWIDSTGGVTGHYTSMINPSNKYVAIADFYSGNAPEYSNTVSGEFSSTSANLDTTANTAAGACVQKIEVLTSSCTNGKITGNSSIYEGNTTALSATVTTSLTDAWGRNAVTDDLKVYSGVTWTSSNKSVATVSGEGVVTGISKGNTTITATVGGSITATLQVSVIGIEKVGNPVDITIDCGDTPSLPDTLMATMSDNSQEQVSVQWKNINSSEYNIRNGGIVEISGTVNGFSGTVMQKVNVLPATIEDVNYAKQVTTDSGNAPTLDKTATVSYSNGDVETEAITWENIASSNYTNRKGGSFEVKGTIAGIDVETSCTVVVNPATITTVSYVKTVTTESGVAPVLPVEGTINWSNGETTYSAITWDSISKASYSMRAGGSFSINGTMKDYSATLKCVVTVKPAKVKSIAGIKEQIIEKNNTPVLPNTTKVTWSNWDITDETIAWESFDSNMFGTVGTYTITGAVGDTKGTVTAKIIVRKAIIVSADVDTVYTEAGIKPQLPSTVQVHWSDNTITTEAAEFDPIPENSYMGRTGATFSVNGTVLDHSIVANVVVNPATVTGHDFLEDMDICAGEILNLPQYLNVYWSNSESSQELITWDKSITEIQMMVKNVGTYVITGTAAGVSCEVTVNVAQASIEKATVSLSTILYTYTGLAKKPAVIVKLNGITLKSGVDYKVTYPSDMTNTGLKTITVTGLGNYKESAEGVCRIKPAQVKNVTQSTTTKNGIKLAWTKTTGATGYEIYRATSSTGNYVKIKTITSGSTVSYANLSLTPGKTYYYKIRAYKTSGGSNIYGTLSTATKMTTRPNATTISLTGGKRYATIKWGGKYGAVGYRVYMATSKNGKYTCIATKGSTYRSYTKTKLTSGKTYYFKVVSYTKTAKGGILYSGWSPVKSIRVR